MRKIFTLVAALCLVSISFAQYTMEDRIYDYIDDYKDLAMQEMELYGVPASITLAQAIYASQAGTNDLVRECHNHVAIMCHTQEWTGETYYRPADKKQENCYRKYATDADSYRDHSLFLSTRSRYVKLFYYPITDYRSWATGLLEAGFSGNPKYADTLISIIEKYYLMHYDRKVAQKLGDTMALRAVQKPQPERTASTPTSPVAAKPAVTAAETVPAVKQEETKQPAQPKAEIVQQDTAQLKAETPQPKPVEPAKTENPKAASKSDTTEVNGIQVIVEKPEKKKAVGSEFYNTLSLLLGDWFMKAGATLPPCDWKTRDAFANMDIAGYNYGIFRYKKDLRKYPERLILGSETLCKDAYAFWEIAQTENRIIGDFVWPGMDYMGEVNAGGPEFADYNTDDEPSTRLTGSCGRVDLIGKPRAEAAFTKVALGVENGPRIGVIPVYEETVPKINGWMVTKAVESWSWQGCEGKTARVEVYARAYRVELLLNGRSVANKKVKRGGCRTFFDVPYESGELTAVSYDRNGKEIGRYSLSTAKEETVLTLLPEENTVKPNGLAFIRLSYTDRDGIWKPMEQHTLTVEAENGTLIGLGSACPYKRVVFGGNTTETYFGDALAVVRAGQAGKPVVLKVSDEKAEYALEISCEETK